MKDSRVVVWTDDGGLRWEVYEWQVVGTNWDWVGG